MTDSAKHLILVFTAPTWSHDIRRRVRHNDSSVLDRKDRSKYVQTQIS